MVFKYELYNFHSGFLTDHTEYPITFQRFTYQSICIIPDILISLAGAYWRKTRRVLLSLQDESSRDNNVQLQTAARKESFNEKWQPWLPMEVDLQEPRQRCVGQGTFPCPCYWSPNRRRLSSLSTHHNTDLFWDLCFQNIVTFEILITNFQENTCCLPTVVNVHIQ